MSINHLRKSPACEDCKTSLAVNLYDEKRNQGINTVIIPEFLAHFFLCSLFS